MIEAADIGLQPVDSFNEAWCARTSAARLEALAAAGRDLHQELAAGPKVQALWAADLVTLPYPASYGLSGGTWLPFPYVWLQHRMLIVRFRQGGSTRTLLFNATDHEQARKTPFFWHLSQRYGETISNRLLSHVQATVPESLRAAGVAPEEVDFVAYDHLHTQDIRRWAGTVKPTADFGRETLAAALPNATFLIQRREWATWEDPHPLQRAWYVPGAIDGLDTQRVAMLDGTYRLGDGLWLLATPGHTMGNHSLAAATESGVFVVSENGVSVDCYAPRHSSLPGLRRYAEQRGVDVILNSNTLESSLEQYGSMILERSVAGPSRRDERFPNVYPSSELRHHPLAPGLAPAFIQGRVRVGSITVAGAVS